MNKWALGAVGAILVGEGILAKMIVESHNRLIDAMEHADHHFFEYWHYMGWREHEERAEYNKRWDEFRKKQKASQKA